MENLSYVCLKKNHWIRHWTSKDLSLCKHNNLKNKQTQTKTNKQKNHTAVMRKELTSLSMFCV